MGNYIGKFIIPAGKYDHNPLVGHRPMVYPYTFSAQIAQFPYVFHYRYTMWGRTIIPASVTVFLVAWKLQSMSFEPSNVAKWKQIRKEWYGKHYPPEYDLY